MKHKNTMGNRTTGQWVWRSLIASLSVSFLGGVGGGAVAAASTTLKITTVGTAPGLSQVITQYEKLHADFASVTFPLASSAPKAESLL